MRNPFGIRSNPFGPVQDMFGTRRELFYPCGCCFARSGVVLTRIIAISSVELFLERFGGRRFVQSMQADYEVESGSGVEVLPFLPARVVDVAYVGTLSM